MIHPNHFCVLSSIFFLFQGIYRACHLYILPFRIEILIEMLKFYLFSKLTKSKLNFNWSIHCGKACSWLITFFIRIFTKKTFQDLNKLKLTTYMCLLHQLRFIPIEISVSLQSQVLRTSRTTINQTQ